MNPQPTCRSLLIVWHSRTGAARQMARAAEEGAKNVLKQLHAHDQLRIIPICADQATTEYVLGAAGFIFCAPENLGSLSGAMKEFFDRNYYSALDRLNGLPAAIMIAAGSDGQGAVRQTERICTGWRLRLIAPSLIVHTGAQSKSEIMAPKQLDASQRQTCAELGGTLAALLV